MAEKELSGPELISAAENFAKEAHEGLPDKAGRDYYQWHLLPIATGIAVIDPSAEAVAAAWLHDVIEDTDTTAEDLLTAGFPPKVVEAVVSVTRLENKAEKKELYFDLIDRAAGDDLGRFVKLADNAWNIASNPGLAKSDPEAARGMLRRYKQARSILLSACGLTLDSPKYMTMIAKMEEILGQHP